MAVGLGGFCLLKEMDEPVGQAFLFDERFDFGGEFERFVVLIGEVLADLGRVDLGESLL